MNDLISRQEAIDEVVAWLEDRMTDSKNGKPLTERLRDLPSAQPEIIRCNSCRHDNNCAIQDIAQTGGKFFCGFARQKGEEDG